MSATEASKCRRCGITMVDGKAMAPVYGRLDGQPSERGHTCHPIDAVVVSCKKCPQCGRSYSTDPKALTKTVGTFTPL